jgi:hypothetical protein
MTGGPIVLFFVLYCGEVYSSWRILSAVREKWNCRVTKILKGFWSYKGVSSLESTL